MKKIGIFGGTFDPIHIGHLRTCLEVKEEKDLDRVFFVPNNIPPHKDTTGTPPELRYEMVKMAVKDYPFFEACDLEIKRGGRSFTIDTIREFKEKFGRDKSYYFIVGSDAFSTITTWKSYEQLLRETSFIVMYRSGHVYPLLEDILNEELFEEFDILEKGRLYKHRESGTTIEYVNVTLLEVSSTYIRNLIKKGRSIKLLVPEEVKRFIEEKDLYRWKS